MLAAQSLGTVFELEEWRFGYPSLQSYRLGLYNIENIEAPSGVNQSTTTWLFCLGLRKKLFK